MKDGMRFVDCDMHIQEPVDLFDKYMDPEFRDRVSVRVDAKGNPKRGFMIIDEKMMYGDFELQQHRKPRAAKKTPTTAFSQPLLTSTWPNWRRTSRRVRFGFTRARWVSPLTVSVISVSATILGLPYENSSSRAWVSRRRVRALTACRRYSAEARTSSMGVLAACA